MYTNGEKKKQKEGKIQDDLNGLDNHFTKRGNLKFVN